MISVITTTYNSEQFVEATIMGVLNQNIDIPFEYIIADDASSDDTLKVVERIKKEHPKGVNINILENETNQGVMKNFFKAVLTTKGEYIAFCDSDDVWKDLEKLKKQSDCLVKNQDASIVYHSYINIASSQTQISQFEEPIGKILPKPQTSTMMVKGLLRGKINHAVVKEAKGPQNDQYLRFLLSDEGKFFFIGSIKPNERVVRENSIFSTVDKLKKKKNALQSWQTFYKYHGAESRGRWLAKKVIGFQSAVYWLQFKDNPSIGSLQRAVSYDIKEGLLVRKSILFIKQLIFYPYRLIKNSCYSEKD